MTNEEAREQIDNLRAHCSDMARSAFTGGEVLWAKDVEALTQAIKALAQEPCEDAISRQAVEKITWEEPNYTDTLNVLTEVRDKVRALPSVTPQPKTGHCKDCKYFEYDSVAKVDAIPLIIAHEICNRWGDGCKTREDGYCFLFEPKEK